MKVFNNKNQLSNCVDKFKTNSKAIGFVPTMGALHNGHLSLVEKGLLENDFIVVSIFVNPTQFNNKEDLERYPRTVNRDLALLETVSKSKIIVFIPSIEDIYEDKVSSEAFAFDGLEHEMEGAFRPGHFDGVGTVVKRLLEIVRPDNAYFGEKDFQQLQIIKKMIELHKLTTKIVGCAIYRADDGLAMSSRNERLKPNYRKQHRLFIKR